MRWLVSCPHGVITHCTQLPQKHSPNTEDGIDVTLPVEHLYWLYFLFSAEDTLSIFSSLICDFFLGERKRPVYFVKCGGIVRQVAIVPVKQ